MKYRISAVFLAALVFCAFQPERALSQEYGLTEGLYAGVMGGLSLRQEQYRSTSFDLGGGQMLDTGDIKLELGYGGGVALVFGTRITDYVAVEIAGTWSRSPAEMSISLPSEAAQLLGNVIPQLPPGLDLSNLRFAYDGTLTALQSKIDLLLYPVSIPVSENVSIEPYGGGGAGVVRSTLDIDYKESEQLKQFASLLPGGASTLAVPQNINEKSTDFQLSLRAGVNVPISSVHVDLGWQYYRTYVDGKDGNSHLLAGIVKYMF